MEAQKLPQQESLYFEMLGKLGFTKHLGALQATEALVELCGITQDSHVLDVGCGVGATPVYLARKYGCRVVGVDITPAMITRAHDRARQSHVQDLTEFRVADMHDLPFPDEVFDAVIAESVVVFSRRQVEALREMMRVVKAGGYVGITEATWTRPNPPPEVVKAMTGESLSSPDIKHAHEWEQLLKDAGLTDVVARASALDMKEEAVGRYRRLGCWTMLRAVLGFIPLMIREPRYKDIFRDALGAPVGSSIAYTGYGVYVGQRPPHVDDQAARSAPEPPMFRSQDDTS